MKQETPAPPALAVLAAAFVTVGCGPGDGAPAGRTADAPLPDYPAYLEADGMRIPAAVLARGDSVFHGRGVGSICSACHGREGVGSPMVSTLTDNSWTYSDGSLEDIREVTRTGVQESPTPMPPMGGATLSEADLAAVAAYVYWISRRDDPFGEAGR